MLTSIEQVYECGMEIRETSGGQLLGAGSLLNLDRLWFKKDFMSDISDGFNRMSCYLKLVTSPVPTVWTAIRLLSGEMPTEHDWFILNDQTCGKAGLFDMKNKLLQEEIAWLKQQSDAKHQGTIVKLEALLLSDEVSYLSSLNWGAESLMHVYSVYGWKAWGCL
jgi:hypothetical protein